MKSVPLRIPRETHFLHVMFGSFPAARPPDSLGPRLAFGKRPTEFNGRILRRPVVSRNLQISFKTYLGARAIRDCAKPCRIRTDTRRSIVFDDNVCSVAWNLLKSKRLTGYRRKTTFTRTNPLTLRISSPTENCALKLYDRVRACRAAKCLWNAVLTSR